MQIVGQVFQINVSDGGVPKHALNFAKVCTNGVIGDRQQNKEFHGGPDRALCLYSLEKIQLLQAEGHPIYPGAIGENLTLSGLDWGLMVPGAILKLGEEVKIEITRYTQPCKTIATAFKAGEYGRIAQTKYAGWSRVYARVLNSGSVRAGDKVVFVKTPNN